jgi:hypothetical protein
MARNTLIWSYTAAPSHGRLKSLLEQISKLSNMLLMTKKISRRDYLEAIVWFTKFRPLIEELPLHSNQLKTSKIRSTINITFDDLAAVEMF